MQEAASPFLAAWSNFYVITGSSAAALTGLMFVVITLVADKGTQTKHDGVSAFSTPTVVHFCMALFVSVVLSAPWRSLVHTGIVLALAGAFGVVYVLRIALMTSTLTVYRPQVEDWIWYTVLPVIAYATIAVGAIVLHNMPVETLFALGGAVMLLVFIAIHNAWDVVTFIAIDHADPPSAETPDEPPQG